MKFKFTILTILILCSFNLAAQDFNAMISTACDSLAKKVIASGKRRIAVVDFANINTSITELGVFLSEEVSSELSNKTNNQTSFKVLERTKLEQILKEKELIKYYNNNSAMAMELGRLSVADILICATITEFEGYYRVVLKLLDTKDGDALSSHKMNLVKNHSLEELNKHVVVESKTETKTQSNQETSPKPETEAVTKGDLCFSFQPISNYEGPITILLKEGNESFDCGDKKGIKTLRVNKRDSGCFMDIPHGVYTYIAYLSWYNCGQESIMKTETIRFSGSEMNILIK